MKAKADGRASDLMGIIEEIRSSGATSLRELAAGLNTRGITTARGGTWSAVQVSRSLPGQIGRQHALGTKHRKATAQCQGRVGAFLEPPHPGFEAHRSYL